MIYIYVTRILGANSTTQFGIGCSGQVWRRRSSEIVFLIKFLELAGGDESDYLLSPIRKNLTSQKSPNFCNLGFPPCWRNLLLNCRKRKLRNAKSWAKRLSLIGREKLLLLPLGLRQVIRCTWGLPLLFQSAAPQLL